MDNRISALIVAGLTIITEILCNIHPEPNENVEELCDIVSELQVLVPEDAEIWGGQLPEGNSVQTGPNYEAKLQN